MPHYEVKAWITVEAEDENAAEIEAGHILDSLPESYIAQTSIEGEGAVYELDGYDEEEE